MIGKIVHGVAALSLGLMPWAAAQTSQPTSLAPVPLSPSIMAVPNAPLPAPAPSLPAPAQSKSLPAPDLPAPNLPAGTLTMPPPPLTTPGQSAVVGGTPSTAEGGAPAQVKPIWKPRRTVLLDVLDKEDGAVHRIDVPVGSSASEGRLSIEVGACVVRPKDMTADAATFLTVTSKPVQGNGSSTGDTPLFRGWLIRSEPGATVVGDAAVTFRLIGCGSS
ncbi:DUF2155 domain-containing protein [Acidiphilium sp. PA]|uniref:DUF2155 domain-containing protein n=1 Tax=Acidiphilium sp. PA TaxID=2871705 RepID=UPI00224449B3|nr:DUF2155 domain-containing protein [Acidiphilium sp. PA]MCW8305476.1 DUF2155 domain-containing protein [Acidiphilium sp. PA]